MLFCYVLARTMSVYISVLCTEVSIVTVYCINYIWGNTVTILLCVCRNYFNRYYTQTAWC